MASAVLATTPATSNNPAPSHPSNQWPVPQLLSNTPRPVGTPVLPPAQPVQPTQPRTQPKFPTHLRPTQSVPVVPAQPIVPTPIQPTQPVVPTPTQPTQPVVPTPTQPAQPVVPTPVQPTQPVVPTPIQPTQPVVPTPTQPVQPTQPVVPTPIQPTQPVVPTPTQPVQPTQPVVPTPTQPIQPTQPVVPTPTQPTQPVVPTPTQPIQPEETASFGPTGMPIVNLRGLWVDAFGAGLKTPKQVRTMVKDAANMGINTLFIQAIRRGDCLCLKSGLPVVTDKNYTPNFDALELATKLAHQRGIKVIAWVSVTGIANVAAPNTSPAHVLKKHGPDAGKNSWMNRRPNNTWRENNDGWLDPAIPEAADYMVESVVNLVKNYPVDGVQLDRIRYPDGDAWGYDPKSLARFRTETGRKGTPTASDPIWQQWKRQQVTALVRRIALEVKAIRPNAWMSAATITYGQAPPPGDLRAFQQSRTYKGVLQDWPTWIHEGLIDLNVPMNYKRDKVGSQGKWFDAWNDFAGSVRMRADGKVAPLAIGTAMYLNTPQITYSQAKRSLEQGLGWVGYSYRTPTLAVYGKKQNMQQGLTKLHATLNGGRGKSKLLAPHLQWNAKPPTVRGLMGQVVEADHLGNHLVQALQNGKVVATTLTDGNGYYGFLTLPAGKTEVRVSGQRWPDVVPEQGIVHVPKLAVRELQVLPTTP